VFVETGSTRMSAVRWCTRAVLLIGRALGKSSSSADLVEAWIERAEVRTYKHLREEIDAVLLATSIDPRVDRGPPTDEDLEAIAKLERRVQSGELFRSRLGAHTRGPQTSVALVPRTGGSLRPLRLTLPVDQHLHWQHIEAAFRAVAGPKLPSWHSPASACGARGSHTWRRGTTSGSSARPRTTSSK
jgi:hypothetical protein